MTTGIIWGNKISEALKRAASENKLVLLNFSRPDCEACRRMAEGVFPNIELQEFINNHFVPVKFVSGVDADQFYRYDVKAEPAFLVLDQEGNEVFRKIGYFEADLLIEKLEKARKKAAHRKH